ncbi:putative baculoviral inhibition of apoptosis protein repeat [Lyophyllum shimeji]|uniref:Baculoviral inhibition of apoptosis protein repeat n=1 Tax=Lyophyllum shimeji TaxID=47721 RepID=A0A9P3PUQ9_LYOSH|nr:putative baculoviral inhibition of apoptosis protein repeat [Lyophyllum shimeji]
MESLQNRIDSFSKVKRVKNPEKPTSTVSLKWPHPPAPRYVATPETLAEAGFYFNPSFDDRDNVTCFMCEKQLSDWEAHDDPFDIHWNKCGDNCCWAMVRCGLRGDLDGHGGFIFSDKSRIPTSKAMERARLETFSAGDGWMHDQEKNHGASSRKMARAGFVFTPQHVGDDLATCLYCNVALSGWDADDDPLEEHRKRAHRAGFSCPMFVLPEAQSKPPSRSQSQSQPKPASKSQPPKQSRTASTSKHKDMVLPMKTHDGDGDESDALPASSSRRSTARGRSAPSASKGAKTPKRPTRSQSRSELKDVAEDDEGAEEDGEEQEEVTVPVERAGRGKKKSTVAKQKARSRSKSTVRSAAELFDDEEDVDVVGKTASRSRSKAKAKEEVDDDDEEPKVLKKSTRGKVPSRVGGREEEEEVDMVLKKSTRGKAPSRAEELEEEAQDEKVPKKSTRGKALPPATEDEDDEEAVEVLRKSTRGKPPSRVEGPRDPVARKASKTRKTNAPPEPQPDPEPEPEVDKEVEAEEKKPRQPSRSKAKAPVSRKPSRTRSKVAADLESTADDQDGEEAAEPAPPLIVEKKRMPSTSKPASAATKAKATPPPSKTQERVKAPSPETAAEQEAEGIGRDEEPVVEDDEMDTIDMPPASPFRQPAPTPEKNQQQQEKGRHVDDRENDELELAPLVVPKRDAKPGSMPKAVEMDIDMEKVANGQAQAEAVKKPGKDRKPSSAQGKASQGKPTKEKSQAREKADASTTGKVRKASSLRVVEISTDEEGGGDDDGGAGTRPTAQDIPPMPEHGAPKAPSSKGKATEKARSQVYVEVPRLSKPSNLQPPANRPQSPPPPSVDPSGDVEMASAEPEARAQEAADERVTLHDEPAPSTPPRPAPAPTLNGNPEPAHPTLPMPPLSKLPFTPLQNLTEAELDMTVEEWIRYQMEVEYDKFRRDGERELGRFKKRAEEVRAIIERL